MFLTVIVCTHNRAELLARCLQSLTDQTMPADAYEVIVVESACTDDTSTVTERFARRYAQVRTVRESRPGKSHALNVGLRHARGTHVACTDDDARAPRTWLERIASAFAIAPPPAVVAGAVRHVHERPPPAWWYPVTEPRVQTRGYLRGWDLYRVAGANLAFDKTALLECGGFSTDHGPVGNRFRLGEDTEAVLRVVARHPRVWYDPGITVEHWVPAEQATLRYLAWRRFLSGIAISRIEGTVLISARTLRAVIQRLRGSPARAESGTEAFPSVALPRGAERLRIATIRLALLLAEKAGRVRGARLAR